MWDHDRFSEASLVGCSTPSTRSVISCTGSDRKADHHSRCCVQQFDVQSAGEEFVTETRAPEVTRDEWLPQST